MKILITGAKGFMGRHVAIHAQRHGHDVFGFDLDSSDDDLKSYVQQADAIIHLAGVNRPSDTREFYVSNVLFTQHLIQLVQACHPTIPVIFASSIQADLDNDYGKSKKLDKGNQVFFSLSCAFSLYACQKEGIAL